MKKQEGGSASAILMLEINENEKVVVLFDIWTATKYYLKLLKPA